MQLFCAGVCTRVRTRMHVCGRAEETPPRHPTGINTALLTIIVTVSSLYSNTTLHSITMASGVYPYKPEIINGEVSSENDIFAIY